MNGCTMEKSNFIPVRDESECNECGICIEKCQFNAWDEDLNFIEESCVGCGVCEVNCPVDAITMEKIREEVPAKNPYEAWKNVEKTRAR